MVKVVSNVAVVAEVMVAEAEAMEEPTPNQIQAALMAAQMIEAWRVLVITPTLPSTVILFQYRFPVLGQGGYNNQTNFNEKYLQFARLGSAA